MGENFAFFLPVMMASFGVAFAVVWRSRIRAAGLWSAAYLCVAGGFTVPAGFALLPTPLWSALADLLFAGGFLLFGQALLERWRPGWLLGARLTIAALSVLLCFGALALDNMAIELIASDFGCFLLIGLPLIAGRDHLHRPADLTLFAAVTLVALDNLLRGSTVPFTLSGDDFLTSDYAFLMQGLASIFGLFLGLSALAACIMDLLGRYQRDAVTDPLSGLLNRRGFEEAIARLPRKSAAEGSLIVCDIDHFKAVNDAHGHALGDRAIILLADIFNRYAPPGVVAARFGGEEFVLFLPRINAARAGALANEIREGFTLEAGDRLPLTRPLTASFGLSTVQHSDASIQHAIARADEALYEAKSRGRNRVCVRRALSTPGSDRLFHALPA